jgi:hypothetical protein
VLRRFLIAPTKVTTLLPKQEISAFQSLTALSANLVEAALSAPIPQCVRTRHACRHSDKNLKKSIDTCLRVQLKGAPSLACASLRGRANNHG